MPAASIARDRGQSCPFSQRHAELWRDQFPALRLQESSPFADASRAWAW